MSEPVPSGSRATVRDGAALEEVLRRTEGKLDRLAALREDQHLRWERGQQTSVEQYLEQLPDLAGDADAVLDLIYSEILLRESRGEQPGLAEYQERFPKYHEQLQRQFDLHEALGPEPATPATSPEHPTRRISAEEPVASPSENTQQTAAYSPSDLRRVKSLSRAPRPAPQAVPGYEILAELGRGAMGVVYKARQIGLKRLVALKMIRDGALAGGDHVDRFLREAEAVARLQHPNVVQIYEVGEQHGLPYFAMEHVEGGTLEKKIAATPQPAGQAAHLIEVLARAIHHAHTRQLIHRDLKPANVLLTSAGEPKITDFGLAKHLEERAGPTHTGDVLGTPSYMAPEQARGSVHEIGPPTDVYALGAILYDLLTGRPPFRGETAWDTMSQVIQQEPVPPSRLQPKVPRDLETICLKCLRKEPRKRYASAAELAEDLRRYQAGEPIRARAIGPVGRLVRWGRRRPVVAALVLALALLTVSAGAVVTSLWLRAEDESQKSRSLAETEAKAKGTALHAQAHAQAELRRAEDNLYLTLLTSSEREWAVNKDLARARALLAQCSPELRGWEWRYLRRLFEGGRHVLQGHAKGVVCLACSPEVGVLASAGEDGTVLVWDVKAAKVLQRLKVPGKPARLLFSPDGRRLACVATPESGRGRAVLTAWDAGSGKTLFALQGVGGVATWSPDGKRLAGSRGRDVLLWDGETGRETVKLSGHTLHVLGLAFSPDGKRLASCAGPDGAGGAGAQAVVGLEQGNDGRPDGRDHPGEIFLWDVASEKLAVRLKDSRGAAQAIAFSPDGKRLACAGWDRDVVLRDASTGAEQARLATLGGLVHELAFSPDGRLLGAVEDEAVRVWEVAVGKPALTLGTRSGQAPALACSSDGRLAFAGVAGQGTGEAIVRELGKKGGARSYLGHTGAVAALAFGPGGRFLVTGGTDGAVRVWDATGRQESAELAGGGGQVAFHPDGAMLAVGGDDGLVRVWDLATRREKLALRGHTAGVRAVAFSSDGNLLASAARDFGEPGEVKVWDVATGKELTTLPGQPGVNSLAFVAPGERLAMPGKNQEVRVWPLDGSASTESLPGFKGRSGGLAVCDHGRRLACRGQDASVALWDMTAGTLLRSFESQPGRSEAIALARPGGVLAAVGGAGGKQVWVWDTGGALRFVLEEQAGVSSLAVSDRGERLAMGTVEGRISIWNLGTGQRMLSLAGHQGSVLSVAFQPGDGSLASSGVDGVVRIWDASPLPPQRPTWAILR